MIHTGTSVNAKTNVRDFGEEQRATVSVRLPTQSSLTAKEERSNSRVEKPGRHHLPQAVMLRSPVSGHLRTGELINLLSKQTYEQKT